MNKNKALVAVAESDKVSFGFEPFSKQSVPQNVFSAVYELHGQVNNGGFWQYFANTSAETACFVEEALRMIGANRTAEICRTAIEIAFPGGLPSLWSQIRESATERRDQLSSQLNDLDCEFFQYPDDLTELLYEFILKHPDEFGSPPFERTNFDAMQNTTT